MVGPAAARIDAVSPVWAVEGGRLRIIGENLLPSSGQLPNVFLGGAPARVVSASSHAVVALVPPGLEGGATPLRLDSAPGQTLFVTIGAQLATGLHQVDNPVFDRDGNLYATYSGSRGEQTPVSIFRVSRDRGREPFATGITNATSMAFDAQGRLHVSSRFDGAVYRILGDGERETAAEELGVACGLAFGDDGSLFVGDRSGTVFRLLPSGPTIPFAMLPPSVAAFHLAFGPDGWLYVTGPTLGPIDSIYRIDNSGTIEQWRTGFGRPQGLAFDSSGDLYVVEALAGRSAVYRIRRDRDPEVVLTGAGLVGVAFDPDGGLAVSSNLNVYRFETPPGSN